MEIFIKILEKRLNYFEEEMEILLNQQKGNIKELENFVSKM